MTTTRNWPEEISTEQEAYVWFLTLLAEDGVNFHPDDPAEAYEGDDAVATFTADEVEQYNNLRAACFGACDDVYAVAIRAMTTFQDAQVFRSTDDSVLLHWEETTTPVVQGIPRDSAIELALSLNTVALKFALETARREVARA